LKRLPDWRQRLHDLIASRRKAAFSWGANHGGIFAAAALEAITGERLYPDELLASAKPEHVEAEALERAKLKDIESQYRAAAKALAVEQAKLKDAADTFWGRLAPSLVPSVKRSTAQVEAAQQRVDDLAASHRQQALAVQAAAKRVMDPILADVEASGGVRAMVTARLGAPLPGVLLAQYGDLVMATVSDGQPCLGICLGGHCAFISDHGLSKVRLSRCDAAWHIPCDEFAHVAKLVEAGRGS